MPLRLTSRPEAIDATPAYSALRAHLSKIEQVRAEDTEWAHHESEEVRHVQAASEVERVLAALEQRRVSAIADQEVLGSSVDDPEDIARQVASVRASAVSVHERARLAVAKLDRIRERRAVVHAERVRLHDEVRPLQHAARTERLAAAMDTLLTAERAYMEAFTAAFGLAAAIDELAKAPGIRLEFAGSANVGELVLPRPHHPSYADRPSPMWADISAAIATEGERVAKEL
jgi:hypothetical protein